jgi:ligand-binding sensor domain-containing protein
VAVDEAVVVEDGPGGPFKALIMDVDGRLWIGGEDGSLRSLAAARRALWQKLAIAFDEEH